MASNADAVSVYISGESYQAQLSGEQWDIPSGTISPIEVGSTPVVVTAIGAGGYATIIASIVRDDSGENNAPTGSVTISGTATQGQTLTASNTLADADGLGTISYQWKAGGVAISGATGSTYTLTQAEVGKAITVTASYTDGGGTAESSTSAATAVVELDPALLFAGGEAGCWFEPDVGVMYQDYAGMTPVTAAAQPVGLIMDKSRSMLVGSERFADAAVVLGGPTGYAERLSAGVYRCYRDAGGLGTVQLAAGLVVGRMYRIKLTLSAYSGSDPDVTYSRGTVQYGSSTIYDSGPTPITAPMQRTIHVIATASTMRVICSAIGTGITISGVSICEIAGNHAQQSVSNARPLFVSGPPRLVFDGIDDSMLTTFPSALGSSCTVVLAVPGVGAQILTGQTIGTTYTGTTSHCGRIIVNRALTAAETVGVTRWANQRAGV